MSLVLMLAVLAVESQQVRVDVTPKFRDGVHFACEASFSSAIEDTAYHGGELVGVSGSFALYYWPDGSRLFVAMKLGVMRDGPEWNAPSNAYIVNSYRTNLSEQLSKVDSETSGFGLFIYDPGGDETANALGRLSAEGRLDVAYTMNGGTMPATFTVRYSDSQANEWGECVRVLLHREDN